MRKADLQVGEEYAVGSPSRYDRYNLARVRIVSLNGEGENAYGRTSRGIVVALVGDSDRYRFRGKDGDQIVLQSARDIQRPWAQYAKEKAAHDERVAAHDREMRRRDGVAEAAMVRLAEFGFTFRRTLGGTFMVDPDEMAQIVALLPER